MSLFHRCHESRIFRHELRGNFLSFYRSIGKRICDVVVSATLLIIFSPVIFLVFILNSFALGPTRAFFVQLRPGLNTKPFYLLKFRTMNNARDSSGALKPDSERLTALGRVLRASSLDELPQLINVIKGDMSLVGPRPLLMEYLPRYSPRQARRHEVRPGITGLAQVNGRNLLLWPERFALDVDYVDNVTVSLDLKIIAKTVLHVLKRTGIRSDSSATMTEFLGEGDPGEGTNDDE